MQRLLVHFDVAENYVRLDTFIASARAAERSANAFNRELFSGKLQIELIVFAPEPGSLKQYIGITVRSLGGFGAFLVGLSAFLDSPSIQKISEEVFGTHATEAIVQEIRQHKEWHQHSHETGTSLGPSSDEQAAQLSERLLVRSVEASLRASRETITSPNLPAGLAYETAEAQAKLFGSAFDDPNVKGIGFSEDDDFPIPRHEFARRAIRPRPPKDDEPEEEWEVSLVQLRVTSPNFDREDQAFRKWKGKSVGGSYYLFEVLDEEFWSKIRHRELEFSEGTEMVAQLATRVAGGPKDRRVLRVLKLDGTTVAEPLDENALGAALGRFKQGRADEQNDLFSGG